MIFGGFCIFQLRVWAVSVNWGALTGGVNDFIGLRRVHGFDCRGVLGYNRAYIYNPAFNR